MPKDKRSFFERLTGSVNTEEVDDEKPVAQNGSSNTWVEDGEDAQLTVDVYQTPTEIIVKSIVAGVKPEDLQISITRDMFTVSGKREEGREAVDEDYFCKELYWGSFSRTIMLPQEVDPEEAEAIEKHGLLTVRMPKLDKDRQTKLKVRSI